MNLVTKVQNDEKTIRVLLNLLKIADEDSYYHSISVATITEGFLELMEGCPWTEKEKEEIIMGALLHDIGKAFLPFHIQSSSSDLDFNRKILMQAHPNIGYEIVRDQFSDIVENIILLHHQKADGSGYPYIEKVGIFNDENIPLYVVLVSYADILDALVTAKPYRVGYSLKEAKDIICQEIDDNKLSYRFRAVLIDYIEKNTALVSSDTD